jgi:hypothetical protein
MRDRVGEVAGPVAYCGDRALKGTAQIRRDTPEQLGEFFPGVRQSGGTRGWPKRAPEEDARHKTDAESHEHGLSGAFAYATGAFGNGTRGPLTSGGQSVASLIGCRGEIRGHGCETPVKSRWVRILFSEIEVPAYATGGRRPKMSEMMKRMRKTTNST